MRGGAPKKNSFNENALSGSIHSTYQLASLQTDQIPTLGQPSVDSRFLVVNSGSSSRCFQDTVKYCEGWLTALLARVCGQCGAAAVPGVLHPGGAPPAAGGGPPPGPAVPPPSSSSSSWPSSSPSTAWTTGPGKQCSE